MIEPAPSLTRSDAERLTQRIRLVAGNAREALEKLHVLVDQARNGGAHAALGFASWTAYLQDALGQSPLRLDREQRRELVSYLAGEGMSTRAIAPIVGASQTTVVDDLRLTPQATGRRLNNSVQSRPDTVTSLDGRQRPATKPQPDPAPAVAAYPELQHYVDTDRPAEAVKIAKALDGFDDAERDRRRGNLAKHIAADKRGDLVSVADPRDELHAEADRLFLAANAATRTLRDALPVIERALPHEDALVTRLWREEYSDLAALCIQLAAACAPRGLRVVT